MTNRSNLSRSSPARQPPVRSQASREFIISWSAVANAKLVEYRRQCWRLSGLVRRGTVIKAEAIDKLWEIAVAHALVRSLGDERIEAIITEAFAGTHDFHLLYAAELA
jgi:hypothetical protein